MGISCKPMNKLKSAFKKIDNNNERRAKEDRKSSKKKNNK